MTEETKDNVVSIDEAKEEEVQQPSIPEPEEIDFNDPAYQKGMVTAHQVIKRLLMQIIGDVNAVALFVQKGGAYLVDDIDLKALVNITQTMGVCLENAHHARKLAAEREPGDTP